jgi:lysylphosphatidylglycerol synthetase-like protein (DUF2156 family)
VPEIISHADDAAPDETAVERIPLSRLVLGVPGVVARALLVCLAAGLVWGHRHPAELVVGLVVIGLVLRGAALSRPVTGTHLALSAGLLLATLAAMAAHHQAVAGALIMVTAVALSLPLPPPPPARAAVRGRVERLLDQSAEDALAPFALRRDKSYVFSPDGCAAVGYRVRFGIAVVGGDPVGLPSARPIAITEFRRVCAENGWRPAVVGAGPEAAAQWRRAGLWGLAFGRDVVIEVDDFTMQGRRFRNLRQAVQRATNAGLAVEVVPEVDVDHALRAELLDLVAVSGKALGRGFSMTLDGLLDGVPRNSVLAIGRDRSGRVVAFTRFAVSGGGQDLALDVPWRLADAGINGMDERLVVAAVDWGRAHGVRRVSLAFAPFPDLMDHHGGPGRGLAYASLHLLDGLIRVQPLYRYLRKFHAFGPTRSVLFRPLATVPVVAAVISLEFSRPRARSTK